jgi:hypothetical protein
LLYQASSEIFHREFEVDLATITKAQVIEQPEVELKFN